MTIAVIRERFAILILSAILYFGGFDAHRKAGGMPPLMAGPRWLSVLCGKPLPEYQISVFPMVFQVNSLALAAIEILRILRLGNATAVLTLRLVVSLGFACQGVVRLAYLLYSEHKG